MQLSGEDLWKLCEVQIFCTVGLFPSLLLRKREQDKRAANLGSVSAAASAASGAGSAPSAAPPQQQNLGPKSDTKRVYWDVLDSVEGTIWDSGASDLEFEDLGAEFSNKQPERAASPDASKLAQARHEVALVSDAQNRRQNMAIFSKTLTKGGKELDEVGEALRDMELGRFGPNALESLTEFLPEGEEVEAVLAYAEAPGADLALLGPAERLVLALSGIPRLAQRVKTLCVMAELDDALKDIKARTEIVIATCNAVRTSQRFVTLLQIILKVGNELNKGTAKVGAGVRLGSLVKLAQTKSNQNVTLLDYLVANLLDKQPQVLEVAQDFPTLADAARVSLVTLNQDMAKARAGLATVQQALHDAQKAGDDKAFEHQAAPFVDANNDKIAKADAALNDMLSAYQQLAKYVGENPATMQPEDLFAQLLAFLTTFARTAQKARETRDKNIKIQRDLKFKEDKRAQRGAAPQQQQ